jgi:uncharacterized membrane protein (DUF2068 family)
MARPRWVITVAVLEGLVAGAAALITVFMLLGTERAPGEARGAIEVTEVAMGAFAAVVGVSCLGLWKRKLWGWWLALLTNLVGLVIFLWDPIERRVWPGVDELAFIVVFVVLLGLLVLRGPRRFFFDRKQEHES